MRAQRFRRQLFAGVCSMLCWVPPLVVWSACSREHQPEDQWGKCVRCLLGSLKDRRWIEARWTAKLAYEPWPEERPKPFAEFPGCRGWNTGDAEGAEGDGVGDRSSLPLPQVHGEAIEHISRLRVSSCVEDCEGLGSEGSADALRLLANDPRSRQATDRAIAMLKLYTEEHPANPHLWSDLAAAYITRAKRQPERAFDLLHAHGAAQRAIHLDGGHREALFNRALAEEKLSLRADAIATWSLFLDQDPEPGWADEARRRKARLEDLETQDRRQERQAFLQQLEARASEASAADLQQLIQAEPELTRQYFETNLLADWMKTLDLSKKIPHQLFQRALKVADALKIVTGDRLPSDIMVELSEAAGEDRAILVKLRDYYLEFERAREKSRGYDWKGARPHFEKALVGFSAADSPTQLRVRYFLVLADFFAQRDSDQVVKELDRLEIEASGKRYTALLGDILALRAHVRFFDNQHLRSLTDYQAAIDLACEMADVQRLGHLIPRQAGVLRVLGSSELAWQKLLLALPLLDRLDDRRNRSYLLDEAAAATIELNQPGIALRYQNQAVQLLEEALKATSAEELGQLQAALAVALRVRVEHCLARSSSGVAEGLDEPSSSICSPRGRAMDLRRALELSSKMEDPDISKGLMGRIREAQGQDLLAGSEAEAAVAVLSEALEVLPEREYYALRSRIHFERAQAYFKSLETSSAERDLIASLEELTKEAQGNFEARRPGEEERLWAPYSTRFREVSDRLVGHLIEENRGPEAFSYAERFKALEPRYLAVSRNPPELCRELAQSAGPELIEDLVDAIPERTLLAEYVLLEDELLIWVLSHGSSKLVRSQIEQATLEGWVRKFRSLRIDGDQDGQEEVLRQISEALLWPVLDAIDEQTHRIERIVVIADGPIHGVPFAALRDRSERRLVERFPTAAAPSALLYLCAVERDRQMPVAEAPRALLVGDPAFDEDSEFGRGYSRLRGAKEEVIGIHALYGSNALVLNGPEATENRLLESAAKYQVLHFAGHAVANPSFSDRSYLLLAPTPAEQGVDRQSGVLFASELLEESFGETRLVVLSACSSAGGSDIGPIGVATLVRPFLGSGVPAVVGSLWNVQSEATKWLMVRFHRYLCQGLDASAALQAAQLELLGQTSQKLRSIDAWAAFQVVGYASSPFPQPDSHLRRCTE